MLGKQVLVLLRIALGWLMFYAGITKVFNPSWSAAGYLTSAKSFSGLYSWLASGNLMTIIDFINEWGLTLLGLSLIFGIAVRLSSILGAILMLLYYFPVLDFPLVAEHSFIVDEHIIYTILLIYFAVIRAGRYMGLDQRIHQYFGTKAWYQKYVG